MIEADKRFRLENTGDFDHNTKEVKTGEEGKAEFLQMIWSDTHVSERQEHWLKTLKDEDLMDEFEYRYDCNFVEV